MTAIVLSLGQKTAAGAVWMLAQSISGRAIGFLSQLIVAALLLPADFGIIGLAYTVSTFGSILTNFGVESVLLQRQATMRLWIVPAFWYSFGVGLLGLLAVVVVGPIAARLYAIPAVAPLSLIIAVSIPISALGTIPTVSLRAGFRFKMLASINCAEVVLIQGLTIAFAMAGMKAYAFALPLPIVSLLRTVLVWSVTSIKLDGFFSQFRRIKYLANSSLAVFGTGVIQSAISQGDYIVLGLFSDATVVGIYFFAYKLASQPLLMMAVSLSNVLFPALSQLRHSPATQIEAAVRAARLLGVLIMPLAFLQCAVIDPAIHIFFATKWDDSIPLMQVLSVGLGFDGIAWVAAALVTAKRGFQRQFLYIAGLAPFFFILIVIGGWRGSALGVALGVAAYYILVTPIYSYVVLRKGGVGIASVAALYVLPAAMAAIATGMAVLITSALGVDSKLGYIAGVTLLTGLFYGGLLRLLDPISLREIVQILRTIAGRASTA